MTVSPVLRLGPDAAPAAIDVLCDAFSEYPVMRRIIGPDQAGFYAKRLRALVGFFVAARVLGDDPLLGLEVEGRMVATATLTPPGGREAHPQLASVREKVWMELGEAAQARYEAFGRAWSAFEVEASHYHLNMIGVVGSFRGLGLASRLLSEVHSMSREDPLSTGVTLTTENPANVPLYEHVGYRVIGHTEVFEGVETWGFFRPD